MGSDLEGSDSSSVETEEDHVSISLLPEQKRRRKRRFRSANFTYKLREMFGGKAAIYGLLSALLLLSVLLLAVFARPSSSYETVNKNEKKNFHQDFEVAKDSPPLEVAEHGKKNKNAQSLRLPRHLSPIEYLVHLHPDLKTFTFSGKVDVLLYCSKPANSITLHIGSKIHESTVKVAHIPDLADRETIRELKVLRRQRKPGEMMEIWLDTELQQGGYYFLVIEFDSELSRRLSGFYLSKYYSPSGELRYLATTHFEPTDARNAFPCFDEPDMKANFSIVITREKHQVALANMPLSHTDGCGEFDDLCTDHFKQSVKMSTYLVAFVVCDYANITGQTPRGTRVSVWAPPEQIDQGRFALQVGISVLQFYEEIFQVPYPLPKQDLIAVPDFATGAMENWGLITFRLTSILYDPSKSSHSNKQWVAVVVAHELAHQWFGNLVTMKWWNDLWLNEGFASFMENVGVNHTNPEWKMMDQFLLEKFQVSMSLDQLKNSHPIMAEVKDPAQINSLFDSISYDKGASIIRMLEDVLGRDVFFKGLQHYLKKYSFSNAETNDLWQCLTEAMENKAGVGHGIDVTRMMTTWTNQMGFPVVMVTRNRRHPQLVHVEQQHFLVHPDTRSPSDAVLSWVIPLTYITQDSDERHTVMIEEKNKEVHLPDGTGDGSWIKMNAGQSGFYRVNYDGANWQSLIHQLNTDHEALSAADRAGLLEDALNLARAGLLEDHVSLSLTPYLKKEKEYVPWMSALNNLAYFATQFSTFDSENENKPLQMHTDYYTTYKRYVFFLLKDIANHLGWKERRDDTHLQRYLRATVLHLVSEYEDAVPEDEAQQESHSDRAMELFNNWLDRRQPVTPNLRNIVYSIGVKNADEATWNETFRRFQKETVPSEKRKLMYALTNSRNPEILNRLLSYSLQDDKIRSQDSVAVIDSIAHNPKGRQLAWQFVQEKYQVLFKRYGTGSFDFSRLIKANTAHFNTQERRDEVAGFFNHVDQGSGERAVRQSLESIDANIKWIKNHGPRVYSWMKTFLDHNGNKPIKRTYYDAEMMMEKYGRP